MTIRAGCTNCGATLKAEDRYAGKTVACPRCQNPIAIPELPAPEFVDPFAAEAEATLNPQSKPAESIRDPIRTSQPAAKGRSPAQRESKPVRPEPLVEPQSAEPRFDETFLDEAAEDHSDPDPGAGFPDLTDEELSGTAISPRKKKRKRPQADEDSGRPVAVSRRVTRSAEEPATGWRGHLHWFLLLALLPLGLHVALGNGPSREEQLMKSLENHPEVDLTSAEEVNSAYDLAMLFPEHRLDGAFLPADTSLHWVFALLSAGLFLLVFLKMWPRVESEFKGLLISGAVTGTVGIMLLLAFQFIAFSTQGVFFRGRGIGAVLFLIIKLIGFSYDCALREENGFLVSFFGFTFGVGLCEELCKAIPVAVCAVWNPDRSFRSVCLIGLASGVGFGVSEGITYSSDYYNGFEDGLMYLIRFASCVSLHAIWAGGVALLIYQNRDHLEWSWEGALGFMVHYLLVAMLLHGLYDTLLKKEHNVLALLTAVGSFLWFQWLLRRTAQSE